MQHNPKLAKYINIIHFILKIDPIGVRILYLEADFQFYTKLSKASAITPQAMTTMAMLTRLTGLPGRPPPPGTWPAAAWG